MFLISLLMSGVFLANVGAVQPINDSALDKSCITATSETACLHNQPIERWVK